MSERAVTSLLQNRLSDLGMLALHDHNHSEARSREDVFMIGIASSCLGGTYGMNEPRFVNYAAIKLKKILQIRDMDLIKEPLLEITR